ADLLEDARDMAGVVVGAELFFDDLGDAAAGPEVTPEAVGLGTVPEAVGDQVALPGEQLPGRPGSQAGPQGIRTAVAGGSQPMTDRQAGDAQGLSDGALGPALLTQLPGTHAPPLPPILGGMLCSPHTLIL